jgi:hypothetical protein
MQLRIRAIAFAELPCRTRLPFRFGAATVTEAPLLHARLEVEGVDGRCATGMAADLLVPRWFRKDVERPPAADQEALRASAANAALSFVEPGYLSAHDHWWRVYSRRIGAEVPTAPDLLERGFGVALCERALLDAACRLAGKSFWSALQCGLFRQPSWFQAPGAPWDPAWLPARPTTTVLVRHTVGMLDPLRAGDVPPAERTADGSPQMLDEILQRHGVRWLKIKIGAGLDPDRARLLAIGALLHDLDARVQITLDGNEQFADFEALDALWRAVDAEPRGRELLRHVRWVEQPLPRAASFAAGSGTAADPARWTHCPIVLDEGDAHLHALPQSGYDGVSAKNCKGVFRTLANREFVRHAAARFQTAEDLTCLPVLALQQDLATVGALGLEHSERNGHHYFDGLRHLPPAVAAAACEAHPDLYERGGDRARLRIERGVVAFGSLLGPGFGCDQGVIDALDAALAWREPGAPAATE